MKMATLSKSNKNKCEHELAPLRKQVNRIDDILLRLLVHRFKLTRQIGTIKKENRLPIQARKVEEKKMRLLMKKHCKDIDKKFIKELYGMIFTYSRKDQKRNSVKKR